MPEPLPEEQRLRAELARARGALAHMQKVALLGTWTWHERARVVEWSDGLKQLLGVGPNYEPGLDAWMNLVHPDDRARVLDAITVGSEQGSGYRYACRLCVGGEERRVFVHARVVHDEEGNTARLDGIVQDVTEWHRSEAALAQSEAVRAAVSDAALDSVIVMDADGLVVEWNRAAERTFGWTRAEAVGQELAALIIPSSHRAAHRSALETHGTRESSKVLGRRLELSAVRRDGAEFPVELAIVPVLGERLLFAGYLRDITERKKADEARRAAESRWRALVEQLPAATYLAHFDASASMLYMSPQIERLTGYAPEGWMDGKFWLSRVHPEDLERVEAESRARYAEKRGFSGTYRFRRADGTYIWVEEQSTLLYGEEGEPLHLQGVMVDVTERRRREEELRAAHRLESVGQLAGGVAHDFNNLLGIILGYAELLESTVAVSSRSDVHEIRKAAERAAELTRQLLLFGRREPDEAIVVDANDVVADLQNMLARTLGEHVDFTVELASGPCMVRMPAGQLEQILVNLVVNARDAMPGGGRLVLSTASSGERVLLRVADSGTGMTDEVAARAFDPFFTTKEKGRGSGLGLATVYGMVQRAGGRVTLDTLPGSGTTVEIELPLAAEEPAVETAAPEPPGGGHGETVLVVEDEPAVRELTGRILAENGYRVIDAADGYRARILCDHFQGEIDLVLSDVVMPGMSGRQVAEQLRTLRPGLKVLYMSGYADEVLDHHGVAGEDQLLEKPFDRERLLASVRAALS